MREDGRPKLPLFLKRNPDTKDAIESHDNEHLHDLPGEFMHSFIHNVVLPEVAKKRTAEL